MKSMSYEAIDKLKGSNRKALLLTLTTREYLSSYDIQSALNTFWTRFKRKYNLKDYIVSREYQKRGALHYHIIIFDTFFIPREVVQDMWIDNGNVDLKRIWNLNGALSYLIKYITKNKGNGCRLHCSFHLLDSLSIRFIKKQIKQFFIDSKNLINELKTGRISMELFDSLYRLCIT